MMKAYDVTAPLSPNTPVWPGDPTPEIVRAPSVGDGALCLTRMNLGTHTGTHVDAPLHLLADGLSVDALPIEILLGKVRVVEIAAREGIERQELEALDLRDDLRLLIKTRMSGQMRIPQFQADYVFLTADAAQYLVQVGLKLVGIDYLSVDRYGSTDFPAHRTLLGAGVILVEGLDLSEVEPGEYDMVCLPIRLAGADGAPARVILRNRP